jgi:hypothetical protein
MVDITRENFHSEVVEFRKRCPDSYVMIRPDRPFDQEGHRYHSDDERRKGNIVMKAWFEYLAAKGFVTTFNSWRAILKAGKSIAVVCPDPIAFDMSFMPPSKSVLAPDFWDEFERSRASIDRRYDSPENRARLAKIARDCAYEMRMVAAKCTPNIAPPVRPLREWKSTPLKDIDATNPIPEFSEELRAKLGCGAREVAE